MSFNPFVHEDSLDVIRLAGEESPGWCYIEGASSPRGWDEQQGYGTDGASLKWKGDPLPEFTVKIQLWEPEHYAAWNSWRHLVKKTTAGIQPKAMIIEHPQLDELDIRAVVVTDTGQFTQVDDGVWEIPIKFKAYRKPKPALAQPPGAIDKPNNPDDAPDRTDFEIAQLSNYLKGLKEQDAQTP